MPDTTDQNNQPTVTTFPDFMVIRRRLSGCADPASIEAALQALKTETGTSIKVLRECAKEIEKEKRERWKEQPRRSDKTPKNGKSILAAGQDWTETLLCNKDGEIRDCPYNVYTVLSNHPEWVGRIRRNALSGCTEIDGRAISEPDIFGALRWCGQTMRMAIRSTNTVYSALTKIGHEHAYHPIIDYLENLPPWDGTDRVPHLFADFLGAHQNAYVAHVAQVLLCGMIARAYMPGCIMRQMPILEGPERIGKSRFVRDLGYPWSAEISSNLDSSKQFMEDIQGVWLAELMEMDALKKASASRIKAALSQTVDRWRMPWTHVAESHPRTTVFIGTVNPNQAASLFSWDDQNTRFLPVVVKAYNAEAFTEVKDQLFAEAKAILAKHPADWWREPEAVQPHANSLREERSVADPWLDAVHTYLLSHPDDSISIPQLMSNCLVLPLDRQDQYSATRVGKILRALGWVVSGQTRNRDQTQFTGGVMVRVYRPAEQATR